MSPLIRCLSSVTLLPSDVDLGYLSEEGVQTPHWLRVSPGDMAGSDAGPPPSGVSGSTGCLLPPLGCLCSTRRAPVPPAGPDGPADHAFRAQLATERQGGLCLQEKLPN